VVARPRPARRRGVAIIDFRRGDRGRPRGHALAYFDSTDGRVLATYLVVPPIVIDLAKYMPPMFAGHLPTVSAQDASAMPLPPVPEEVAGGLAELERLADLRDDDLVYCGRVEAGALDRLLLGATEAGGEYSRLYRDWLQQAPAVPLEETPALDVDEVMRSLMGDHDRVAELAKLIGRLRYAVEVADPALQAETVAEMQRIGRHMADKYRAADLIAAAQRPGVEGARLAELHVQRCYKLATEEYADVARIEAEIKRLDGI
jgi:hypothetical protein